MVRTNLQVSEMTTYERPPGREPSRLAQRKVVNDRGARNGERGNYIYYVTTHRNFPIIITYLRVSNLKRWLQAGSCFVTCSKTAKKSCKS